MHRDDAPTSVEVTASPGAASAVSSFIGPYRILQVLGEGGMGIVYLAEQSTPIVRRVALKILKLGMDTKQFVARFEAERQALAVMDHPGIAPTASPRTIA
jgi:serine/threonine protein kinase